LPLVDKKSTTLWKTFVYGETMKRPVQISYRITEEQARYLDERRGQVSRGECARQLMVAGLEGRDSERLVKYLGRIHSDLDEQYSHQATDTSKSSCQFSIAVSHFTEFC